MKNITRIFPLFIISILLAACAASEPNEKPDNNSVPPTQEPDKENEENDQENAEEPIDEIDLSDFFLPDGTKAYYKGEGNEFAELEVEVHTIGDDYVVIDENNGGVIIRKVYRIEEDQIIVLSENPVDLNEELPTENDLNELNSGEIYLQKPLKAGTAFGDQKIIETDATVETPYQTFDNAIVLEMVDDGFVNYKYLVPEFGEVKRKSIMKTDDEQDFIVTSALEKIK